MKVKKYKKVVRILQLLLVSIVMIGCTNNSKTHGENAEDQQREVLKLYKGAFVNQENNNFETYNFTSGEKYESLDTEEKIVTNYNSEAQTYTFYKDNSYFINYKNDDIKIEHGQIASMKISPDGNYLFYFVNEEYLTPVVMDLKNKKEIYLENNAVISGQFIDWIDDNKLAYYGVDTENRVSGIFIFDVATNIEEKLYDVKNGYVKFLKHIDNGVALVEEKYGEESILNIINVDGTVKELSNEIVDISDIIMANEKIYVLGSAKNNTYSIYEIEDNILHRVIYDFPSKIIIESGLSINEEGELLFVGGSSSNNQYLYKYSNGSVSMISDEMNIINFINIS